jgi:hypothetical protein
MGLVRDRKQIQINGGKGGVGPTLLHTTLEGPTEYVNARCTVGYQSKCRFRSRGEKNSRLPILKASRELKNWYFPTKFLPKNYLQVNYMYANFEGQKIHRQKVIQNLPTLVAFSPIVSYNYTCW